MAMLSYEEFVRSLENSGICKGDIVMVQSDLRLIGPIDAPFERKAYLDFFLNGFKEAVGDTGTICVCTFFYDYARFQTPFHRESSPSNNGVLSEYIRTTPGAVRSHHPVFSVTSLGARSK